MDHLFSPELDALIAHHNRMEGRFPLETFPYDQKPAICEWLRRHSLEELAEGVEVCEPMTVGMYIAGYRHGFKQEERFWEAFTGIMEAKS